MPSGGRPDPAPSSALPMPRLCRRGPSVRPSLTPLPPFQTRLPFRLNARGVQAGNRNSDREHQPRAGRPQRRRPPPRKTFTPPSPRPSSPNSKPGVRPWHQRWTAGHPAGRGVPPTSCERPALPRHQRDRPVAHNWSNAGTPIMSAPADGSQPLKTGAPCFLRAEAGQPGELHGRELRRKGGRVPDRVAAAPPRAGRQVRTGRPACRRCPDGTPSASSGTVSSRALDPFPTSCRRRVRATVPGPETTEPSERRALQYCTGILPPFRRAVFTAGPGRAPRRR